MGLSVGLKEGLPLLMASSQCDTRPLSRILYVNNGMATISSYALKVVREREVVDL